MTKYKKLPAHDEFTGAIRIVDEVYSNLYEGLVYKSSGVSISIDDGIDDDLLLKTPLTPTRIEILGIELFGEGSTWLIELYETPAVAVTGPELLGVTHNLNRNSSNTIDLEIYNDPTLTDDGVLLDSAVFGGVSGQGNQSGSIGGSMLFNGWIFQPDTFYNIRITNGTGTSAVVGIGLFTRELIGD